MHALAPPLWECSGLGQSIFKGQFNMMFYIAFTAFFAFATGFQVGLAAILMNWGNN